MVSTYLFIYLWGCTTFLHFPAPIWQLYYLLLPFVSVIPVFFHQSLFLHQSSNLFRPGKFRSTSFSSSWWAPFQTIFGSLPSSIRWTCPYHFSCLVLISSKRDLVTFIFCLIILFLILSFLEIRAERRQKSISVEFSFPTVFAFKHHVSAAVYIYSYRGCQPCTVL